MKLWSLQILRFAAALGVAGFHAAWWTFNHGGGVGPISSRLAVVGAAGVDLFFVISGFIIARTSGGLAVGTFVAKRARRILPLYWLAVLPYIVWRLLQGGFGWREALASLLLWPATDRMTAPVLPVGWTLCFEALFYAAFALLLWRRWLLAPVLAVFVLCLALGGASVLDFVGNPLILEFLIGVGLAQLPPFRLAGWGMPLALLLLVVLAPHAGLMGKTDVDFLVGNGGWARVLAFGLPCGLLVWGALQYEAQEGALTRLGDASYAIYLFHLPTLVLVAGTLTRFADFPADFVVTASTAAAVLVGWRVHVLFERPILAVLARSPAPVG